MYTIEQVKIALSLFDDKRLINTFSFNTIITFNPWFKTFIFNKFIPSIFSSKEKRLSHSLLHMRENAWIQNIQNTLRKLWYPRMYQIILEKGGYLFGKDMTKTYVGKIEPSS